MNRTIIPKISWLDPIKAFALLGVMLNHTVEELAQGSWFIKPTGIWAVILQKTPNILPGDSWLMVILKAFAWIGDYSPGVFIFASGFGLAWATLHVDARTIDWKVFFQRRVMRLYPPYILLHILFLIGSIVMPSSSTTFADPKILLSLLGIRITDSLFFFINPSWWFVWLIIQLYLVFPILFWMLRKLGIGKFLIVTFLFTILSRLSGILDIRYSDSLYFWMLGIFFGTRLIEFSIGIALAAMIKEKKFVIQEQLQLKNRLLLVSVAVLILGLGISFIRFGNLIDYLLITVGLTGIFYSAWVFFIQPRQRISRMIIALGLESYGIYLIHQLILQRTLNILDGHLSIIGATAAILVSFPAGIFLTRCAENIIQRIIGWLKNEQWITQALLTGFSGLAILVCVFLMSRNAPDSMAYRLFAVMAGCGLILFAAKEIIQPDKLNLVGCLFCRFMIFFSGFALFVFPTGPFRLPLMFSMLATGTTCLIYLWTKKQFTSWAIGSIGLLSIFVGLEIYLNSTKPLETSLGWGELPALEVHPTRTYALKPGKTTHLRYNHYDYFVKTNSLGFNSPEIEIANPSEDNLRILVIGDAFSMPEGMDYEEGYAALLEKNIANAITPRQVQVINGGVTGYGPAEEYPQLKELAPLIRPDIVIYQFFIDEFPQASAVREARLANIGLSREEGTGLTSMIEGSQVITYQDVLYQTMREKITGKPENWRYEKSLLAYYEINQNRYYTPERLERVDFFLSAMKDVCKDVGATLIIYFVPGAVEVTDPSNLAYLPWDLDLNDQTRFDFDLPFRNLLLITEALNIPVVNLKQPLKSHPAQPVYFSDSWHWNPEGHQAIAAFIASDLESRGLLKGNKP